MRGSSHIKPRWRRAAAGCGGVLVAAMLLAPVASAAENGFTLDSCLGEGVLGRGSSFQTAAHTYWNSNNDYHLAVPNGCGPAATNVLWDPTGSGIGRAALGEQGSTNPTGERDTTVRFAGTDEPPTPAQVSQMEKGVVDANGQDATAADNGKLHVLPVAIGAITVVVNLPGAAGDCTMGTATNDPAGGTNTTRPLIPNSRLEQAFAGDITTWGQLIPTIADARAGAGCAAAPIKRVVRLDSSGSTFAFKDFLSHIDAAPWAGLSNTDWPKNGGATAVVRADDIGGGSLRTKAAATDGSISYLALSDARGGTNAPFTLTPQAQHDDTFWLPIERQNSGVFDDPQEAPGGYQSAPANPVTVRGADCRDAPITGAATSTRGDWSHASAVYNSVGYGICTLTYDLVFDDNSVVYCNSDSEQRKARTIKDYLQKAVLSDAGQQGTGGNSTGLPGQDYDQLPADILQIAKDGVSQIGWNKGGQGRPCTPIVSPPPPPPGNGGGTTTPPPAAPSNAITITSARVSGTTIKLSIQCPGAGKLSVASSAKPKKGKAVKLATKNLTVTKAGAQSVSLSLSSAAKKALKKDKKLKFAVKVTFTPNGGTAKTVTKTVTVKQPKKKK